MESQQQEALMSKLEAMEKEIAMLRARNKELEEKHAAAGNPQQVVSPLILSPHSVPPDPGTYPVLIQLRLKKQKENGR